MQLAVGAIPKQVVARLNDLAVRAPNRGNAVQYCVQYLSTC